MHKTPKLIHISTYICNFYTDVQCGKLYVGISSFRESDAVQLKREQRNAEYLVPLAAVLLFNTTAENGENVNYNFHSGKYSGNPVTAGDT